MVDEGPPAATNEGSLDVSRMNARCPMHVLLNLGWILRKSLENFTRQPIPDEMEILLRQLDLAESEVPAVPPPEL